MQREYFLILGYNFEKWFIKFEKIVHMSTQPDFQFGEAKLQLYKKKILSRYIKRGQTNKNTIFNNQNYFLPIIVQIPKIKTVESIFTKLFSIWKIPATGIQL